MKQLDDMMSALPYQQRDEFDQELYRRPFSHNARKLMQLIYSAANGSPGDGIEGRFSKVPEPMYVMVAPDQATIAKRCHLSSDTEVRRVCRELEGYGFLRRKTAALPSGGRETRYYLSLGRMLAVPEVDLDSSLGRALQDAAENNPFDQLSTDDEDLPVGLPVGLPVVMKHEHAKEHEYKTHEHEGMKHESSKVSVLESQESQPRKARVQFSKISKEQFRRVVRGRDAKLFEEFFQDALSAGWAKDCEVDRIRMAGLFHQVHRRNEAKVPGAVINKQWRLRDSVDVDENGVPVGLHLSEEDEDFATLLIRPPVEIPANSQPAVAMKAHAVDVDLSPEELRRQAMVREANVSAFRAMTRQTVHS